MNELRVHGVDLVWLEMLSMEGIQVMWLREISASSHEP